MKVFIALSIAVIILLSPSYGLAQSLKDAPVVFRSGNWKVLRTVDKMNDKTDCTGIYKEDYGVQLTEDTLFLKVQGGVEAVTLRFGDKPAQKLRLAKELEKKIRSVMLTDSEFAELTGSGRLIYQVNTVLDSVKTNEINLSGFEEALANIQSGCPVKK